MARLLVCAAVAVLNGKAVADAQARASADVLVFAAASLQTALDELVDPVQRATGVHMRVSYAASSALARQIESGAPVELFISADLDWMDYLEGRHLIRADTRCQLLGNRLVLIAPKAKPVALKIGPGFALAAALGRDRLAIADPAAVPAGKYARAALTNLGVWDAVAGKIAAAENVRAALLLVSRGEAPLGIVYRSDAVADAAVVIVDTFPESTHPAIVYPAALTSSASASAGKVLAFLKTPAARAVFDKQGFTTSPQ
jgi:molybdate transport system substrate-binding protein